MRRRIGAGAARIGHSGGWLWRRGKVGAGGRRATATTGGLHGGGGHCVQVAWWKWLRQTGAEKRCAGVEEARGRLAGPVRKQSVRPPDSLPLSLS